MSQDTANDPTTGPTKPTPQHEFLQRFVGEWRGESTMMTGPDAPPESAEVHEEVTSLGGLFAHIKGATNMPGGTAMRYFWALGFDVTFEEYRGVFYSDVSSHIWVSRGELSPDGNTITLTCEGPNMNPEIDSQTAIYRDVHHFESDDARTMTSSGQNADGSWYEFQKVALHRV